MIFVEDLGILEEALNNYDNNFRAPNDAHHPNLHTGTIIDSAENAEITPTMARTTGITTQQEECKNGGTQILTETGFVRTTGAAVQQHQLTLTSQRSTQYDREDEDYE